jgi:flagellar protein FliS
MYRPSVKSYREAEVLTAPPGRLLVMTFDALLAALMRARVGITMGDESVTTAGLDKAREALGELLGALDRARGGEIAERLAAIYVFLLVDLGTVALRQDVPRLERHIAMLRDLREAFATAAAAPQALAS